ncbi:DegT/DnrJ/EryC1/StrS family aminotransferase [Geminicoccaceae bacterium 1502E]|nr:DegT/DnrJ/EryC1/StrS family aminotransferase [Geminicoccaceae bacterium 1502E]
MAQAATAIMPATAAAAGTGKAPWPFFAQDEIEAAGRVLASGRVNYWTGEEGRAFEREFAAFAGTRHAIALANGSLAIELALIVLGIRPGDEVVVTPRSYFASASSVALLGAVPVFADIDRDSQNITPSTIERVLTPRTKAVMPVHLAGWPCDMPGIIDLAKSRNLAVIEDCAQAHGAEVGGRRVGSFGHFNAFSFCQDKIMTTAGEGGMITTDDEALWREAWSYKDHGKSWEAVYERTHAPGFRWLHEKLGSNWRLTEVQSAIGRLQLAKLGDWLAVRARNAGILAERLGRLEALRVPSPPEGFAHAWYKFYCFIRPEALKEGWSRDRVMGEVTARGVPCFSGACPEIYREKAMAERGFAPPAPLPVARELGHTSLMLLVHPTLDEAAMHRATDVVEAVVREATR